MSIICGNYVFRFQMDQNTVYSFTRKSESQRITSHAKASISVNALSMPRTARTRRILLSKMTKKPTLSRMFFGVK